MIERLLIVDDDAALSRSLEIQLKMKGYAVSIAETAAEGLREVEKQAPDLVLLDINLPDADGLSILKEIGTIASDVPIVMVTARQDMGATISAMRSGAFDYIRKPFDIDDVLLVIEKLNRQKTGSSKNCVSVADEAPPREIVGASAQMLEILKQIGLLSRSRVRILIQGESGTGKELAARALHEATSPNEPFVAINCSAIVPTLLESELFGHEKGSFTGADRSKIGKLEYAAGGTLFFDEIGDMDIGLQAKLLRVLQEQEFERVGGTQQIAFKARIVCATHRDLKVMVKEGTFREDLLYRIAVSELVMPPLRERPEDIRLIVQHLLGKLGTDMHKIVKGIDNAALRKLEAYSWPGNVRELENVLARAIALSHGTTLVTEDFAMPIERTSDIQGSAVDAITLADAEKAHIQRILLTTDHNITQTAKLLQISPTTLRKKITNYEIG